MNAGRAARHRCLPDRPLGTVSHRSAGTVSYISYKALAMYAGQVEGEAEGNEIGQHQPWGCQDQDTLGQNEVQQLLQK